VSVLVLQLNIRIGKQVTDEASSISIEDVENGIGYVNSLMSTPSKETISDLSSSLHSEMAGGDQQLQDQQDLRTHIIYLVIILDMFYRHRYHSLNTAHNSYYH